MPRLYILDSHGQLYASYYAIRNLTTPRGEPVGATFGFTATLLKVLREERPEYLVAAFDSRGPTVRHAQYADYKATRKAMPEDLGPQIDRARRVLEALGVATAEAEGFEADDCIAALARQGLEAGLEVVICSRDKDLEQLVGPGVTMLDTKGFDRLDTAGIEAKRGVTPAQMTDVLALMGDASDNIPGVPGVGEKTAVKLIAEHGSLEAVLAAADGIKGKLGERLRAHADQARLSRALVVLREDAPVTLDLQTCATPDGIARAEVVDLFRELGFNRFIEEFELAAETAAEGMRVRLADTPEKLNALAAALAERDAFAFDTETTGLDPLGARLVGLSFAWSAGEGWYVPVLAPERNRCLPLEDVVAALGPALASADRVLVGQNLKYDLRVCRHAGLEVAEPLFDTMVAAYLVQPGRREYGLDALALELLGHRTIPLTDLLGPKKTDRTMAEVPLDQAAEYAAEDAVVAWRLKEHLEAKLAEAGLEALARDVEMPLVPVLVAMEEAGVAVDTGVLEEISAALGARLEALEREIYEVAGHPFTINSPQQLAEVLFDEIGLKPLKKTAKGGRPSTAAGVLEELAARHPLPRLILEYRQLAKLKSTYVDALPQLVSPETGRIHTSLNQTVTATGRLSSSDPNLQNIPIRTEEGRQIRRAFVAGEPGWVLLAADYSQIELRMLAHYSGDAALVRAFREDRDIHTFVASEIYGVAQDEVTYDQRRSAKIVNFSLIYGKTAYGLSRDLGIGVGEAEAFIDEYFARYQGVRTFTAEVLARAKDDGYVTTLLGRRRYIEGIDKMDPKRLNLAERAAVNTVVQGSAADLIKVAMNRIHRHAGETASRLLLQIHDELIFELPEGAVETERAWIEPAMTGALALDVPLKVKVAVGTNWLEAE